MINKKIPTALAKIKNIVPKKTNFKWLLILVVIFFTLFVGLNVATLSYQLVYEGKFYPGLVVGDRNLGGQTQDSAFQLLESKKQTFLKNGLTFQTEGKKINIPAVSSATDPDLSQRIFNFDINTTLALAYQSGRRSSWPQNLALQLKSLLFGHRVPVSYELNSDALLDILQTNFQPQANPAQDAKLIIDANDEITVQPEKSGFIFDYDQALAQAQSRLALLKNEPIEMAVTEQKPKIFADQTASAVQWAQEIISTTTPTLIYANQSWPIKKDQLKNWLEFKDNNKNEVGLQFNLASTTEFLAEIASAIDVPPQDAKFKIQDSRVSEFQFSRDGKKLNFEKTLQNLNYQFFYEGKNQIELVVEITPPKVRTADANNLGIKELIGRGVSNFKGSPQNRRHNIAVGAKTLNGVLIAPGQEFSLLSALGEVDAAHGYLPELVIKGDRTIPEYGGGLCQIGTTTFRAALRSGLPITERQNHSYRVVYYEPAGMDATIYNPRPDMKFLNDTGAYILFTTKVEGDNLIFEFYGTPDGRQIEITPDPPAIYNITSTGEPREIETDELPPGEKKLVEHSHRGADTHFDYIVTYPDGKKTEKRFSSHYVAWPEVWLVGKQAATTTEEVISGGGE